VSAEEIPDTVRDYFGYDKVSIFGDGGMPAAPPAPPGSTARKQGDVAVADALAKAGTPGVRPGAHATKPAVHPTFNSKMRAATEEALFEASMRRTARARGGPAPYPAAGAFWRRVFVPVWSLVPWGVKRRIVNVASGVKGFSSR
jgi:hypothetical protein